MTEVWRHIINTTTSAVLARLVAEHNADLRCCRLKGFWTATPAKELTLKNALGFVREGLHRDVEIDFTTDNYLASIPFLDLEARVRSEFGVPTISMQELGLFYRFKGHEGDPSFIRELFLVDSTKSNWFKTRRAPDGYCSHPNDWIGEGISELKKEILGVEDVPRAVKIRMRDGFLVTDSTEPDVLRDEGIMLALRQPMMLLVRDDVRDYRLSGMFRP